MHCALLADIGVPMIFVQWPPALLFLLPVIVIEALTIRRVLATPTRKVFAAATKANLISTLVGVPLAWLVTLIVGVTTVVPASFAADKWHWEMDSPLFQVFSFVFGIAWIFPPDGKAWLIPLAAALLLVPTFFVSVWIEGRFYRRSLEGSDVASINRAVRQANLFWDLSVHIATNLSDRVRAPRKRSCGAGSVRDVFSVSSLRSENHLAKRWS
jgi:hypothetical protein